MKLQDYKAKYDSLSTKRNLTGDAAMEAVKQDGYALQYVSVQTEAICLEAVKKDGYALKYVSVQTEAICLEAVKKNGDALKYVDSSFFDSLPTELTISDIERLTGISNIKIIK